jgi:DNA-directed RNA polymerase specialized sigma24 family protein
MVTQEAFLSIWRSRLRYDQSRGSVRTWVLGIVHNRTIDALQSLGCPMPAIWRPPNGDIKDPESYAVAAAHRLRLVTWTLQTCDWSDAYSADRILDDIDSQTREDGILRPDSVVLMHDTAKTLRLLAGLLDAGVVRAAR